VLTAELCVLQVGGRDVTPSVYRQLDKLYDWDRFEAFGRVRDGKTEPGLVQLVGRDCESGALVSFDFDKPKWTFEAPQSFYHWAAHNKIEPAERYVIREADDHTMSWQRGISDCTNPHVSDPVPPSVLELPESAGYRQWYLERRCDVDLDALRKHWEKSADACFKQLCQEQANYDQARALPLIVLTGLK
jgi:hypothetical protein